MFNGIKFYGPKGSKNNTNTVGCTHINEGGIDVVSSICSVTRMQPQMTVGI